MEENTVNIADKVKEIIAKQLNKSVDELTNEKEIVKDLGADSLDVVEMVMNIEEECDVSIPDDVLANIKTVGDIINLIQK